MSISTHQLIISTKKAHESTMTWVSFNSPRCINHRLRTESRGEASTDRQMAFHLWTRWPSAIAVLFLKEWRCSSHFRAICSASMCILVPQLMGTWGSVGS